MQLETATILNFNCIPHDCGCIWLVFQIMYFFRNLNGMPTLKKPVIPDHD